MGNSSPYTILPRAVEDIKEIGDYIAKDNPSKAVSFVEKFHAIFSQLSDMPHSSPLHSKIGDAIRIGLESGDPVDGEQVFAELKEKCRQDIESTADHAS